MSAQPVRRSDAYEEIKRRIIELAYAPGTKLSEARLALELRRGRSPIRSAFSRLQAEGWIAVSPQSGTYVRCLSEQEILDVLDARLVLEAHVARLAALRMEAARLRALRLAVRRLKPRADRGRAASFHAFNELDSLFHASLYEAGGNVLIAGMLQNLLEKVRWIKRLYPSTPRRIDAACDEIAGVLSAIEARDPEAAAQRMREHIDNAAQFAAGIRQRISRKARTAKLVD